MIFKTHSDGEYHAAVPEHQIEFRVSRLRFDRHELHGELSVTCGLAGARVFDEACLNSSSMNFSSAAARVTRGKYLAERARTAGKVDWIGLVEELCTLVLTAERQGQPAVMLSQVRADTPETAIPIDGIPVYTDHSQVLFGDGGTGKSLLALNWAGRLEAHGERVLYLDWELTAGTHHRRLRHLFGADRMPSIRYVFCDRPLVQEVDRLRRIIADEEITFGIFDSCGFACDGAPESAEAALGYFRAVRQLRIGGLHTAHITKAENGDQRPFGSAFWHNSARSTWFIKTVDTGPQTLSVGLINRKDNFGPLQRTRAYTLGFSPERIDVQPVDAAGLDELVSDLRLWERIKAAVTQSPQTLASLAQGLDAKPDTIKKAVQRHPHMFTRITGGDGIHRIALVERRAS